MGYSLLWAMMTEMVNFLIRFMLKKIKEKSKVSMFGLVFFTILTLLLAHHIAVNIYRLFKDKNKYGNEAKRLPKDFTYVQGMFIAKFKQNLLKQDEKEIKK